MWNVNISLQRGMQCGSVPEWQCGNVAVWQCASVVVWQPLFSVECNAWRPSPPLSSADLSKLSHCKVPKMNFEFTEQGNQNLCQIDWKWKSKISPKFLCPLCKHSARSKTDKNDLISASSPLLFISHQVVQYCEIRLEAVWKMTSWAPRSWTKFYGLMSLREDKDCGKLL